MNPESLARAEPEKTARSPRASRPDVSGTRGVPSDTGSAPGGAQAASGGAEDVTGTPGKGRRSNGAAGESGGRKAGQGAPEPGEGSGTGSRPGGAQAASQAAEGTSAPSASVADVRRAALQLREACATVFPCQPFDPRDPDARWKNPIDLPKAADLGVAKADARYWFSRELAEHCRKLSPGRTGLPGIVPGTLAGGSVVFDMDTDTAEDQAAALAVLREALGEPWRLIPTHRPHRRHAWYGASEVADWPLDIKQHFWLYGETRCTRGYVCLHGAASIVLAGSAEEPPRDADRVTHEAFEAFCVRHPASSKARSGPANGGAQAALVDADGAPTPEAGSGTGSGANARPRSRFAGSGAPPTLAIEGERNNALNREAFKAALHGEDRAAAYSRFRAACTLPAAEFDKTFNSGFEGGGRERAARVRRPGANGAHPGGAADADTDRPARFTPPELAVFLRDRWRDSLAYSVGAGWFLRASSGGLWDRDPHAHGVRTRIRATCTGPGAELRATKGASTAAIAFELGDELAVPVEAWDAGEVVGLPAGDCVDLVTGERRAARPEERVSRGVSVDPEEGPPELWLDVLGQAVARLREPEAVIAWFRWWCRHTLERNCDHEIVLFMYGPPGCGKSTIADVWCDIAGSYATRVAGERLAPRGYAGHSQWIAGLTGIRLVRVPELPEGTRWDVATLNSLSSGEVMEANRMRENSMTFRSTSKLWITGNHRPTAPHGSGIWRRLRVLECLTPHEVPDPTVRVRLHAEAGRILAWALGADREQPECPAELRNAAERYRSDVSRHSLWFDEHIVEDAQAFVPGGELRARYERWCRDEGETPMGSPEFNRSLAERFPGARSMRRWVKRDGGGSVQVRGWLGVRLL